MSDEDQKFWRDFEARDRANSPAAWAVHDHMTRGLRTKPGIPAWKIVLAIVLVLSAILITA